MRVLVLNQAFYPDVVSTAQHAADLARALSGSGNQVTVVAGRRAYDNVQRLFPGSETWHGVQIRRVHSTGFGKGAKWRRAADFASFLLACAAKLALVPRQDIVIAMTSPPLISFLAALYTKLRGGRLQLWVMDLNPDEAIAAGWLKPGALIARFLEALLQYSLRRASGIVVLDRFMKDRITAKGVPDNKIAILPPWSHDQSIRFDPDGREAFRRTHGLSGKYVVMYSGNHSPCHPLDTVLQAALRLREKTDVAFCFVGGGSEFCKVQRFARGHSLSNVICLPYQPLDTLSGSLSSADLHVVVMGDPFVGIVHPCKVYNIVSLGIPFLYIGPSQSHVTDLLSDGAKPFGAGIAPHGDVDAVVRHILAGARRNVSGAETQAVHLSHDFLVPRMVDLILN